MNEIDIFKNYFMKNAQNRVSELLHFQIVWACPQTSLAARAFGARVLPRLCHVRERILDLNHQGLGQRAIAREVRTSHRFVKKVISNYDVTNSSIRTPRANFPEPKIDANVLEYIEVQKRIKPSTYASAIQHRLMLDGFIHPNDLPGTSQINRRLGEDVMFSKMKLTVCPLEAEKPGAVDQQDEYLQVISRYPASNIHFLETLGSVSELLNFNVMHLTLHLQ